MSNHNEAEMYLEITYHHQNYKRKNKNIKKLYDPFYEHYGVLVVNLRKTKVVITVRDIMVKSV